MLLLRLRGENAITHTPRYSLLHCLRLQFFVQCHLISSQARVMHIFQLFNLRLRAETRIANFETTFWQRVFFIALVILFVLPARGYALASSAPSGTYTQGGSIKGKVVADIPDKRKAIAGVVVQLAGDPKANKQFQPLSDVS